MNIQFSKTKENGVPYDVVEKIKKDIYEKREEYWTDFLQDMKLDLEYKIKVEDL